MTGPTPRPEAPEIVDTPDTPATLDDVARRAGVSAATASRALGGGAHVAPATRERVLAAAATLDYVASPEAARLAGGQNGVTGRVAVLVPHPSRWFFGELLEGLEDELRAAELDVLLFGVGDPEARHRFFERLPARRKVDAVAVLACPVADEEQRRLASLGVHIVAAGGSVESFPSVGIDDHAAARRAVDHLIHLGHRRIGMIADSGRAERRGDDPGRAERRGDDTGRAERRGDDPGRAERRGDDPGRAERRGDDPGRAERRGDDTGRAERRGIDTGRAERRGDDLLGSGSDPCARTAGYRAAVAEGGAEDDEELVVRVPWGGEGGVEGMAHLLGLRRPPTAVFAWCDEVALGALRTLRRAGLRVPDDVSVVGVDDHPLASMVDLTTVAQPVREQGRLAGRLVRAALGDAGRGDDGQGPTTLTLPTRLVLRGTTAPPPARRAGAS